MKSSSWEPKKDFKRPAPCLSRAVRKVSSNYDTYNSVKLFRDEMISLHIVRGSMQMVQHHMVYSPERNQMITRQDTKFDALLNTQCWPLILLHHVLNRFLFVLHHVSSISAGFQLIFSLPNRKAPPCFGLPFPLSCPSLQTSSRSP